MELKKTFEGFLNVLNVLNMSHGNGSSTFVSQVMGYFYQLPFLRTQGYDFRHFLYGSKFDFYISRAALTVKIGHLEIKI